MESGDTMSRLFWGTVFIVAGALFLLQSTGVFHAGLAFLPVVAVIFGVYLALRALVPFPFRLGKRSSWLKLALASLIGVWGIFEILHANGYAALTGREAIGRSWPVLLLAIGLALVVGRPEDGDDEGGWHPGRWRRELRREVWAWHHDWHRGWHGAGRGALRHVGRIGDLHVGRKPWRLDDGLEVRHSIGDVRVDLTTADIAPGEHPVRISSSVGEVVVLVPSNCSVRAAASALLGSVRVFDEDRDGSPAHLEKSIVVPDSDVTLDIRVRTRVGSVKIRRVPTAGNEEGQGEERAG